MSDVLAPPKKAIGRVALLATAALGGMVARHYVAARKASGAERLAEALLDTGKLKEAADALPQRPEIALALCAAYACSVAARAAEAVGAAAGPDDPPGYSRTHTHPYTRATATVLTESRPAATSGEAEYLNQVMTYAVTLPDTAEVRGSRRVLPLHMAGLAPARPTPDVAQISLGDEYTAQLESEFEVGEFLLLGRTRLFGSSTLRDNRGNSGRLHVGYDGSVSGTITRGGRVVGRFEGRVSSGVQFKSYQIESGD